MKKETRRAIEIYEDLKFHSTNELTDEAILNRCRMFDKEVEMYWNKTKNLDVYNKKAYFYNLIFSYEFISKGHLEFVLDWFERNNIDVSELIAYDYYNGIGLTTLDLARTFKKVKVFNDCDKQIRICKTLFDYENQEVEFDTEIKDFDVFFSLQEIEHCFEPVKRINQILKTCKDTQYLILGHGFTNDRYCGHYTYYKVNVNGYDELVHHTQAFGYVEEKILEFYTLEAVSDRGKIRIYKRRA